VTHRHASSVDFLPFRLSAVIVLLTGRCRECRLPMTQNLNEKAVSLLSRVKFFILEVVFGVI